MQQDIHNGDAEGWGDAAAGESQGNGKDEPRPWNRHVCCPSPTTTPANDATGCDGGARAEHCHRGSGLGGAWQETGGSRSNQAEIYHAI